MVETNNSGNDQTQESPSEHKIFVDNSFVIEGGAEIIQPNSFVSACGIEVEILSETDHRNNKENEKKFER